MNAVVFWLVEAGIILEFAGAAIGVWQAWETKKKWEAAITVYGHAVFMHDAPTPLGEAVSHHEDPHVIERAP